MSRFMQKWIQPPACLDHGLHGILSSYWLAHFYLMKRTIDVSPAFLEHCLVEKIAVWAYANRDPNKQEVRLIFAWSGSWLRTLSKYLK
jgi:hypothetical protein